jgi:orotate phosphoribosyltransferase
MKREKRSELKSITKNEFIQFLIDEKALRFGEFTLKSGLKSPFFINLGDICSGSALHFVGKAFAEKIKADFGGADVLFGPPYKGISLSSATAMAYTELYQQKISTCYNRKEAKTHGEAGMFVGHTPQEGERIIVVDDVLTTGGTKVEAIELLESVFKVEVAGVIVTVDRRAKGTDAGLGNYKLSSLITLPDIIEFLKEKHDPGYELMQKFYEGNFNG